MLIRSYFAANAWDNETFAYKSCVIDINAHIISE